MFVSSFLQKSCTKYCENNFRIGNIKLHKSEGQEEIN